MITFVLIIVIAALIFLFGPLGVAKMWIPFMGLTVWSLLGMPMDVKGVAAIWLGALGGLVTTYLITWAPTQFGPVGLALPLLLIVLLMFCMLSGSCKMVFNSPLPYSSPPVPV